MIDVRAAVARRNPQKQDFAEKILLTVDYI